MAYLRSVSSLVTGTTLLYAFVAFWTEEVQAEVKLIDLSHVHDGDTVMSGSAPPYKADFLMDGMRGGAYVIAKNYSVGEHGGTHIDAPKHFNKDGDGLDGIKLEDCIAPGVMIDLSEEVKKDSGYKVTVDKLKEWESNNGRIPNKAAVIINFGWSKFIRNKQAYFGVKEADLFKTEKYVFPYLTKEAGFWLADERDVKMLATDTACCDGFQPPWPIHVKFFKHSRRLLVENIKDPGQLPVKGFQFLAAPVKFVGATGVQVRAFAMVNSTIIMTTNFVTFILSFFISLHLFLL